MGRGGLLLDHQHVQVPGELAHPVPQAERQTDVHDQPGRADQPQQCGGVVRTGRGRSGPGPAVRPVGRRAVAGQGDGAAGLEEAAHRLAGADRVAEDHDLATAGIEINLHAAPTPSGDERLSSTLGSHDYPPVSDG